MVKITKKQKILYVIFNMTLAMKNNIRYEDILVESFKVFPKEFQIRYYPKYPDTDTIRRTMYQLIPEGFLKNSRRKCVLTDTGLSKGRELKEIIEGNKVQSEDRTDFIMQREINRLVYLQGFKMFISGGETKIIDRDFYEFFKATVRTRNLELLGNIKTIDNFIRQYKKIEKKIGIRLEKYSSFLKNKFNELTKVGS
jgi:hypothetical protein